MKKQIFIFVLSVLVELSYGQTIVFKKDQQNKPGTSTPSDELAKINADQAITIDCSQLRHVKFSSLTYDGVEITGAGVPAFNGGIATIPVLAGRKKITFSLHCDEGDIKGFTLPFTNPDVDEEASLPVSEAELYFQNNFGVRFRDQSRYDEEANVAYLFLNEWGEVIGSKPVNIDQDDKIYVYLACPVSEAVYYKIEDEGGDYDPADLSIRPSTSIEIADAHGTGGPDEQYTSLPVKKFGPYTSATVLISIKKKTGKDTYTQINSFTFRINKLYHVAVGVSLISSNLSSPDFRVVPLSNTTNTIKAMNTGNRTLMTFNAIWYWSLLQNPSKGSIITRGRDVLKDEPTFTLKRLFPTVGVSIDANYKENFFGGVVYEFARGGSFIIGGHYGKIKELADANFKLGETVFTGAQDDIITTNKWKWGLFLGVNLDTRILNLLFNRGRAAGK